VRILVKDIPEEGLAFDVAEQADRFPILMTMAARGECRFLSPVRGRLKILRIGELIEIEGLIEVTVGLECSRCLNAFERRLTQRFALAFVRELPPRAQTSDPDGIELRAEDMGLLKFSGEAIDLRPAIQEQVVLAFPLRALCRKDCRGLCPQCGADLNRGACQCRTPAFDRRFADLKNFKPPPASADESQHED